MVTRLLIFLFIIGVLVILAMMSNNNKGRKRTNNWINVNKVDRKKLNIHK